MAARREAGARLLQPGDEVLDIGCGPGAFLSTHARVARTVTGLDASRTMVRAAQSRLADRIASGTSARRLIQDAGFVGLIVRTAGCGTSWTTASPRNTARAHLVDGDDLIILQARPHYE